MKGSGRSAATPLAWMMGALVLYASLYPFSGWRWPAGAGPLSLLALPWPPWLTPEDEALNFAGYLPFGLLGFVAGVRGGHGVMASAVRTLLAAALLSYGCELAQHLLPNRHPSLKDWLMNVLGALAGVALGYALQRVGAIDALHRWRQRLFDRDSGAALALLALWPVALMFPTPLPWGLGQIAPRLVLALQELLTGVGWAAGWQAMLADALARAPLSPLGEQLAATCGLLGPVLLVYTVTRPMRHRLPLAVGALVLGAAAMTLSTLLNFGPRHAAAWLTPAAELGLALAAGLALLTLPAPPRLALALALMALTMQLVLVSQATPDPYFAQSLQAWEQGRWVRLHGLAQWIGWLWPFVAMAWLLARLMRRDS